MTAMLPIFDALLHDRGASRIIELGCARSRWLPLFGRRYGVEPTGIDYSDIGCDAARRLLHDAGVKGEVRNRDFFDCPPDLEGVFDVTFSSGVVEHFRDTSGCLRAFARYLRPGGVMVTAIPNLRGAIGFVQRLVDRHVYELHVPLDADELAAAHSRADLIVGTTEYVMSTNFWVLNLAGTQSGTPTWVLKRLVLGALGRASNGIWRIEDRIKPWPTSRLLSPYVVTVATVSGS
jgi:SAM-dependent methyltransferase